MSSCTIRGQAVNFSMNGDKLNAEADAGGGMTAHVEFDPATNRQDGVVRQNGVQIASIVDGKPTGLLWLVSWIPTLQSTKDAIDKDWNACAQKLVGTPEGPAVGLWAALAPRAKP